MFGRYTRRDSGASFDRRRIPLLLLAAFSVPVVALSKSCCPDRIGQIIQDIGFAMLLICVAGRMWCSAFVAGRKLGQIATEGPYALCRHPLYFFSTVGAAGVGASFKMATLAMALAIGVGLVLARRAMREEELMGVVHGEIYRAYKTRFRQLRLKDLLAAPKVTSWSALGRPFLDSCLFFTAVPCALFLDQLRALLGIRPLLLLP